MRAAPSNAELHPLRNRSNGEILLRGPDFVCTNKHSLEAHTGMQIALTVFINVGHAADTPGYAKHAAIPPTCTAFPAAPAGGMMITDFVCTEEALDGGSHSPHSHADCAHSSQRRGPQQIRLRLPNMQNTPYLHGIPGSAGGWYEVHHAARSQAEHGDSLSYGLGIYVHIAALVRLILVNLRV